MRLDDGVEIEVTETEIAVLRPVRDLLDPVEAELATLPVPAGQPVYVTQRAGSDNRALVRCSVLAQRLETVDVVKVPAFEIRKPDSNGASLRVRTGFIRAHLYIALSQKIEVT